MFNNNTCLSVGIEDRSIFNQPIFEVGYDNQVQVFCDDDFLSMNNIPSRTPGIVVCTDHEGERLLVINRSMLRERFQTMNTIINNIIQ